MFDDIKKNTIPIDEDDLIDIKYYKINGLVKVVFYFSVPYFHAN